MSNQEKNTLDEKLNAIKYCIIKGHDEDLQEHLFDLLRGIRVKNSPDEELTATGLKLKSYWKNFNE